MPFDIAKTRLQGMTTAVGVKPEYSGTFDVLGKIVKHEGIPALWKGFLPYWLRLGNHTIIVRTGRHPALRARPCALCWAVTGP